MRERFEEDKKDWKVAREQSQKQLEIIGKLLKKLDWLLYHCFFAHLSRELAGTNEGERRAGRKWVEEKPVATLLIKNLLVLFRQILL